MPPRSIFLALLLVRSHLAHLAKDEVPVLARVVEGRLFDVLLEPGLEGFERVVIEDVVIDLHALREEIRVRARLPELVAELGPCPGDDRGRFLPDHRADGRDLLRVALLRIISGELVGLQCLLEIRILAGHRIRANSLRDEPGHGVVPNEPLEPHDLIHADPGRIACGAGECLYDERGAGIGPNGTAAFVGRGSPTARTRGRPCPALARGRPRSSGRRPTGRAHARPRIESCRASGTASRGSADR